MRRRKIFIFPCNADWSNAGEGRWFGGLDWRQSDGRFQAPLLAPFPERHLAICKLVAGATIGASPGAIADAIEGAISPFAHWLQAPLPAPFSGAIFWLQVPFPRRLQRRFKRASDTRLEASIKEKYWITTLVSRLSLSLIWIWNRNSLLRCPCILCYLNNNFMK